MGEGEGVGGGGLSIALCVHPCVHSAALSGCRCVTSTHSYYNMRWRWTEAACATISATNLLTKTARLPGSPRRTCAEDADPSNPMTESLTFGRWMKRLRVELDLTQEALAEAAGCAPQTIRTYE